MRPAPVAVKRTSSADPRRRRPPGGPRRRDAVARLGPLSLASARGALIRSESRVYRHISQDVCPWNGRTWTCSPARSTTWSRARASTPRGDSRSSAASRRPHGSPPNTAPAPGRLRAERLRAAEGPERHVLVVNSDVATSVSAAAPTPEWMLCRQRRWPAGCARRQAGRSAPPGHASPRHRVARRDRDRDRGIGVTGCRARTVR